MNTKKIVSNLADKQQLSKAETRRLLDTIVEQMTDRLINHGAVHVSGLGTFQAEAFNGQAEAQDVHFIPYQPSSASNETVKNKASAPSLDPFITSQDERSETFMREFLNDLVSMIQKGLTENEKLNIAKWGKFKVQTEGEINERKQTIKFTPYKQLRQQLTKQGENVPPKSDAPQNKPKTPKTAFEQEKTQETSSNPKKGVTDQATKWISAGVAFLAGTVGAWFFFKDND